MTSQERSIYNKHLIISKVSRNKPFKKREDFTGFEDDLRYMYVKKLAIFFSKYADVDMDVYFLAPYKLYPDVMYFDLQYYASPRAVKTYTIYQKEQAVKSPDEQIEYVKKSLEYVAKYCIEKKIQLEEYKQYRDTSIEPEWMYHIKRSKISCYALMEFSGIYDIINDIPKDEISLLLEDFGTNYIDYKHRYNNSKTLKPFLVKAHEKIKFFIDKKLAQTQN